MSVWLHEQRSSVSPYGAPDQRTMFTPDRITIEKLDGKAVALLELELKSDRIQRASGSGFSPGLKRFGRCQIALT
jgi:hypothetical protein